MRSTRFTLKRMCKSNNNLFQFDEQPLSCHSIHVNTTTCTRTHHKPKKMLHILSTTFSISCGWHRLLRFCLYYNARPSCVYVCALCVAVRVTSKTVFAYSHQVATARRRTHKRSLCLSIESSERRRHRKILWIHTS